MTMATPIPDLVLYARADCHLCDEARAIVTALLAQRAAAGLPTPTLVERDIDHDPAWHDAYFATIPVVELASHQLDTVTSVARVRRLLSDVLDTA